MKILVYDVAAEDGGGLFVLKKFYNDVLRKSPSNIEWIFMTSLDILKESENIKVFRYEGVKKSWGHRLIFENFYLPKIIKNLNLDLIISLQNMPIKRCKQRQFVYLHQSLQYCPKKFSFLRSEERGMAIRQHIICEIYKTALPMSDHIFVQTQWIKDATKKWLKWPEEKISVVPVSLDYSSVPVKKYKEKNCRDFFYPARAEMYKNHEIVIEACKKLIKRGVSDFKIYFTIKPGDNQYAEGLTRKSRGLPIEYIGMISYESMWDYYSKTILLFPSYLETCGLPMLEAKLAGAWILASDMPFSREALADYPNKEYFTYNNADSLAIKMKEFLDGKKYTITDPKGIVPDKGLLESMLEQVGVATHESFMVY